MITQEAFIKIYKEQYQALLNEFEKSRRQMLFRGGVSLVLGILVWLLFVNGMELSAILLWLIVVVICFLIVQSYSTYRRDYKEKIVKAVIQSVNPDFRYYPDSHIELNDFLVSGLSKRKPERFEGDDLIQGQYGEISFKMSECRARDISNDSNIDIFNGLFISCQLPFQVLSELYLLPDRSDMPLQTWSQKRQMKNRAKQIPMNDTEFERSYTVFGYSDIDTREMLNPDVRGQLRKFAYRLNNRVSISFIDDRAYCTIPFEGKLFEPALWHDGSYPGYIKEMYNQVAMAERFCDILTLLGQHLATTPPKPSEKEIVEESGVKASESKEHPTAPIDQAKDHMQLAKPLPNSILEVDEPSLTIHLKALYYDLIVEKQLPENQEFIDYLLGIIGTLNSMNDEALTEELVFEILEGNSGKAAASFDPAWLSMRIAPDLNVKYQDIKDKEDLNTMTAEQFAWEPLEFSLAVLKFQVAELHRMADDQLKNPMKEYGVSSPTGTSWFNFTVEANVESGLSQLIKQYDDEMPLDGFFFGRLFQAGRAQKK